MDPTTKKQLIATLRFHARGLELPAGSADDFITRALTAAERSLAHKSCITMKDLSRAVTKELKKYHPDLAYVYQNYDKII